MKLMYVYFSSWLEKEYPKIYIDLITVLKKNNVAYDIIPCTNDIWCRDYMPVQIDEDRFLCYRYYPDYLLKRKSDKRFITDSQEVCMRLGLKTTNTNIIMDGGNIVKVGDKVIMTEKVFQENPDMSPSSLGSKIEKLFECEVVFLPWDRSEIYGHSDGIVKPISVTLCLLLITMTTILNIMKNVVEGFQRCLRLSLCIMK